MKEKWLRLRFKANPDDWRPVKWPPVGPCWCTGYSESNSIVVAFVRNRKQVKEFWPEATDIEESGEQGSIWFTERFPKPSWWRAGR